MATARFSFAAATSDLQVRTIAPNAASASLQGSAERPIQCQGSSVSSLKMWRRSLGPVEVGTEPESVIVFCCTAQLSYHARNEHNKGQRSLRRISIIRNSQANLHLYGY